MSFSRRRESRGRGGAWRVEGELTLRTRNLLPRTRKAGVWIRRKPAYGLRTQGREAPTALSNRWSAVQRSHPAISASAR